MATVSTFDARIHHLDILISVDPSGEELERRLEGSWPTDLAAEKKELQTNIGHAVDAENRIIDDASALENVKHWKLASDHLHDSLGVLIRHKEAIPQELMLWLLKRICVPLAFIFQFRLRDLNRAYEVLNFFFLYIRYTYNYGDRGPNLLQALLVNRVEDMLASVPCEYAMLLRTQEGARECPVSSELFAGYKLLLSEEVTQGDLKARCCELLCVQYYRLGLTGNVWFWLRGWESSIECMSDSIKKEFQKDDRLIVEASLCAEYGTDNKKAQDLIKELKSLSSKLLKNFQGVKDKPDEKKLKSFEQRMQTLHVIAKLRLLGGSGDAGLIASQVEMDVEDMTAQADQLDDAVEGLGLHPDKTFPALYPKVKKAMVSARHEVAIRYLDVMVDRVKNMPLHISAPSRLASALAKLLCDKAFCHVCLFRQKELKFFIDSIEKNGSNSDEHSSCFSSASLKLCTHHCWSPFCQHGSHHGCPEEDEEDEDEDEDENEDEVDISEPADLGHHEYESPNEFYTKRHIESDGNNLPELEKAIVLLNEALDHVKKSGSGVFHVVQVQSFLAATHLLIADSKCRKLVRYELWPLPEQLTPEFFVINNCRTIRQAREYLNHHGTSPIASFKKSRFHYRECAQLYTKHLDSLKYYNKNWIYSIEKQKEIYVELQNVLAMAFVFHTKLCDALSKLMKNLPTEEVVRSEAEDKALVATMFLKALLWSERGRARDLEMQLNHTVQQQQEIFRQPNYNELHAFYMDNEVSMKESNRGWPAPNSYRDLHWAVMSGLKNLQVGAWKVIRSSLDACGEGAVFLEYSFEGETNRTSGEKVLGRVYGVKKVSEKILEPLLMVSLYGDPLELQSVIERLHKSMDPSSVDTKGLLKYNEEEVTRDLEKLYMSLITPHVAEFLKGMHQDHKLVICPSQIFTKVPFAALRNPAEKRRNTGYMFQRHTISITPSLRVLKYNEKRYEDLKNMKLMEGAGASIAMGNPRYANTSKWTLLPDSGKEVDSITSMFPNRCESLQHMDATVENLVDRVKLPSQKSRSQAFVHIAAHCLVDNDAYKQGILKLTDPDQTDIPSSSSMPPVSNDGILSAEDVVQSEIEWRTHMVVLSACGSGKGEIKAEGVLNLPRALMVAGVPCSVVSQWKVEDDSTRRLMEHFYRYMIKGVDVATALRSSMLRMLDKGFNTNQWAPFMVWGLPTVCLPNELLVSGDAGIELLKKGKALIESGRFLDAILPLKRSLKLLKAKKNRTEEESSALVWCLWWLVDCEESSYRSAKVKEKECHSNPIPLKILKYATRSHLDDLKADQFKHLDSAIRYLKETLKYSKDDGFKIDPPTQQAVHRRLGQIYHDRGELCYVQIQDNPLPSDMITNGIQAVLDYYREKDISGEESFRKAFEHLIDCAKLSSRDMSLAAKFSNPWNDAGMLGNILILEMKKVLRWRQEYFRLIKQKLTDCHIERLTSNDEVAVPLSYEQEFRTLVLSRIAEKEVWLSRMYTPECEELSLGWRTVAVDDVTWDCFKLDTWKETLTLAASGSTGIDVVVEYIVDDFDSSPRNFLFICVLFKDLPPRIFVNEVNMNRLQSTLSSRSNPKSGSFMKDLEYLHEILIKPIVEDPTIITMRNHQTIVFIPCKVLEGVPFSLLRDGAQPDGEGYLIQNYTISTAPSFRILVCCSQSRKDLQWLPLMPEASDSSLVLTNPAIPKKEMEASDLRPALIVASHFPTQFKALYGCNSTAESLVTWANLPSSVNNLHCQAFFHYEAEFGERIAKVVKDYGPHEWNVRMAVIRACQYTDIGQIDQEAVLGLVKLFLMRGIPCAVMSNYLVDDVLSHVFFTHLYTKLKNGEGVAAAFRYSVLEMRNEGFHVEQWGAFSVSGDPTVNLPQEMLRSDQ